MKTQKTDNEKKPNEAGFVFPFGDFQKMAEMMKNCCPGEGSAVDCCSMMRRMMERRNDSKAKKTNEIETKNGPGA